MNDDAALLRQYATTRSDQTFTELVERHVGVVYFAALRRCGGDAHSADDITQQRRRERTLRQWKILLNAPHRVLQRFDHPALHFLHSGHNRFHSSTSFRRVGVQGGEA